jgi:hypothetical protein
MTEKLNNKDIDDIVSVIINTPEAIKALFMDEISDEELDLIIKGIVNETNGYDLYNRHKTLTKIINFVMDNLPKEIGKRVGIYFYKYAPAFSIVAHTETASFINDDMVGSTTPEMMKNMINYFFECRTFDYKFCSHIISFIDFYFYSFNRSVFNKENVPEIYTYEWYYNEDVIKFFNKLKRHNLFQQFDDLEKLCDVLIDSFFNGYQGYHTSRDCYTNLFQLFQSVSNKAITLLQNNFIGLIMEYSESFLSNKDFIVTDDLIKFLYFKYKTNGRQKLDILLKQIVDSGKMSEEKINSIIKNIDTLYYSDDNQTIEIEFDDDEI